jgi:hypothetical protein
MVAITTVDLVFIRGVGPETQASAVPKLFQNTTLSESRFADLLETLVVRRNVWSRDHSCTGRPKQG